MKNKQKKEYNYKKTIMASFGNRELFHQFIFAAFGFSVFFFYENVIGLPSLLAALAFVLYSIWNAFNDPFLGWIVEKIHMPWERKNYKRFPWIIIAVPPMLFSYVMIYSVPLNWYATPTLVEQNQLLIFGWYLGSLCFYDTLVTLYEVNHTALYIDKFRSADERRTTQGFGTILGIIGMTLAATIPPIFIGANTLIPDGYITAAWVSLGVGLIIFLFVLPGIFEDKKLREYYANRKKSTKENEVDSFLKSTLNIFKEKRFRLKIIHFFGYQVGGVMIQTSALYVSTYILGMGGSGITILLGAMLIGALISVPIWTYISHKMDNNRTLGIIACSILMITFLPLIFLTTTPGWFIGLIAFGAGIGGNWFIDPPLMGDVLDDVTVRTGKTQYSTFYGIQAFTIKAGQTFIAITIGLSHALTGYIEGAASQTPFAIFGIRIHTAIVPAILMLITLIIFWRYYDLTPDIVAENKKRLRALKL